MPVAPGLVRRTVLLKGKINEKYDERRAGGTITPGHLVSKTSTGTLVVHPTNGGYTEAIFAHEDALIGKGIDDNYSSGDLVRYHVAQKGDVIYGFIKAGIAVTPASILGSNGDGTFDIITGSEVGMMRPEESVDNSAGGTPARCAMRVQ